jgi:hypothetical protein
VAKSCSETRAVSASLTGRIKVARACCRAIDPVIREIQAGAEVDLRGRAGVIRNQHVKQMFN